MPPTHIYKTSQFLLKRTDSERGGNMAKDLIDRYTFGNLSSIFLGPEADLVYGIPNRQRELIQLSKKQIEMQKNAAKYIAASNIQAADMINREIEGQTRALEKVISEAGDNIASAIDMLGDRVCGELSEIRWELEQLKSVSEQILEVLKRPRNIEAQELNRQAARNLINNKIEEAEDRLKRALKLDNTDYQVWMNLSYVSIHKNKADEAITFINDALTLPEYLDNQAQADALWSLARVYYTIEKYDYCFMIAKKSLNLISTPKRIFQTGVYSILSGHKDEGLKLIEQAIHQDPVIFALAATEPDIETIRKDILMLLNRLSQDILDRTNEGLKQIQDDFELIKNGKALSCYTDLIEKADEKSKKLNMLLSLPSYSEGIAYMKKIDLLHQALSSLSQIDAHYIRKMDLSEKKMAKEKVFTKIDNKYKSISKEKDTLGRSLWKKGILYYLVGAIIVGAIVSAIRETDEIMLIIGLTWWGFIIGLIYFLWFKRKSTKEQYNSTQAKYHSSRAEMESLHSSEKELDSQIKTIRDHFNKNIDKI